jgi:hypothetical protein
MSSSSVRSACANYGDLQVLRIRNVSNSGRLAQVLLLVSIVLVVALLLVTVTVTVVAIVHVTARPTPSVVTNLVLTLPASVEGPDRASPSFGIVCIPTGGTRTRSISILSTSVQLSCCVCPPRLPVPEWQLNGH